MKFIPAAVALSIGLSCGSVAYAACTLQMQCDAGNCEQVEICDNTIEMTRHTPDEIAPVSTSKDSRSESSVAAAVAAGSCRKVDICGTTQLVCD